MNTISCQLRFWDHLGCQVHYPAINDFFRHDFLLPRWHCNPTKRMSATPTTKHHTGKKSLLSEYRYMNSSEKRTQWLSIREQPHGSWSVEWKPRSKLASARAVLHAFEITAETMPLKSAVKSCVLIDLVEGCRGCVPPPSPPWRWRPKPHFYSIALTLCSPLHSYTKTAVSFEMYFQQFTLCYCLVKSLLLHIRFWNLFTSPVSYTIP